MCIKSEKKNDLSLLYLGLRLDVVECKDDITTYGKILFGKLCTVPVNAENKFRMNHHLKIGIPLKLKRVKNLSPK